jgi:hypothetical protein
MGFFNRFTKTKKNNSKRNIELARLSGNRVLRSNNNTRAARVPRIAPNVLGLRQNIPTPPVNTIRRGYFEPETINRKTQRRNWLAKANRKLRFGRNNLNMPNLIKRFENSLTRRRNGTISLFNNNNNDTYSTVAVAPPNESSMTEFVAAGTGLQNTRNRSASLLRENRDLITVFGTTRPTIDSLIQTLNNGFITRVFEYIRERKFIDISEIPLTREMYSFAKGIAKQATPTLMARLKIKGIMLSSSLLTKYIEDIGLSKEIWPLIVDFYKSLSAEQINELIVAIRYYACMYIHAYEERNISVGKSQYCP